MLGFLCKCFRRKKQTPLEPPVDFSSPTDDDPPVKDLPVVVHNPVREQEIVPVVDDELFEDEEQEPDDEYVVGGYHPVSLGDVYDDRYRVAGKLGWGVYSTVWRCVDTATNRDIALKIQKSAPEYTNAAVNEIDILRTIQRKAQDTGNESLVVTLLEHFYVSGPHGNHVCMVFELLGDTLLHAIQDRGGLPLAQVRQITRCLLECLAFVHDVVGVLHTDIKPENVLLNGTQVKLVDLGTAFFVDKQTARDIQTREYRCPEGILGIWPFEPAADVWSVGCLVFELLTGETLFDPQSPRPGEYFTKDESHLAQAIELLGPIPPALVRRGLRSQHWFSNDGRSLRNIAVSPPPSDLDAIARVLQDNFDLAANDASQVSQFLAPLLKYEPKQRASAAQALQLPWFKGIDP